MGAVVPSRESDRGIETSMPGSSRNVPSRVPSERQRKEGEVPQQLEPPATPKTREPVSPRMPGSEESSPGKKSASRRVPAPVPSVTHSSLPELGSRAVNRTLSRKDHMSSGYAPASILPGWMSSTSDAV